jgi:hypothetical protein
LKVPESTLRNRLIRTSLGRFKATFSNEEEKELTHYCKDVDAKFYGLTFKMLKELAFEYAELNGIDHSLTKKRKQPERTG